MNNTTCKVFRYQSSSKYAIPPALTRLFRQHFGCMVGVFLFLATRGTKGVHM